MPSQVRFTEVRTMLEDVGYIIARVNGSHHVFVKDGVPTISIPVHAGKVKFGYVRCIQKTIAESEAGGEEETRGEG